MADAPVKSSLLSQRVGRKVKSPDGERRVRAGVLAVAREMSRCGLSPGRTGNVSARHGSGMIITPSGVAYETLTEDALVFVDSAGQVHGGQLKPSSEWAFHLAAYARRPDRHGVVHTHSMHATVLACAHRSIPAFHYMVAAAGGTEIPCVPYATFGTDRLAQIVADGLASVDACLLANHGAIAIGSSVEAALELARAVETLAEQYVKVLAIGQPKLLSPAEMAVVLEKFKGYGQNAQRRQR